MNDDIQDTPSTTPNFQTELAAKLAELVPEAVADGKVDVVKLQELDYVKVFRTRHVNLSRTRADDEDEAVDRVERACSGAAG